MTDRRHWSINIGTKTKPQHLLNPLIRFNKQLNNPSLTAMDEIRGLFIYITFKKGYLARVISPKGCGAEVHRYLKNEFDNITLPYQENKTEVPETITLKAVIKPQCTGQVTARDYVLENIHDEIYWEIFDLVFLDISNIQEKMPRIKTQSQMFKKMKEWGLPIPEFSTIKCDERTCIRFLKERYNKKNGGRVTFEINGFWDRTILEDTNNML